MHDQEQMPNEEDLRAYERTAVTLADLAGARITAALGQTLSVRYKSGATADQFRDPVSEVDQDVEQVIRALVGERFAGHDILGEESEERPGRGHDIVWAVDPIDGTTNFVNGFPLFAASIGVLWRGRPVVGAVWCSTSHALRPGTYHARQGGPLSFDSAALDLAPNPQVRRRLAGVGARGLGERPPFDVRRTGSAAIECAFVAAGLLSLARFDTPNAWDVAGGIPLVQAAGGQVLVRGKADWLEFPGFLETGPEPADLRRWNRPMLLGTPAAISALHASA
ncbi:inositol monophosphatase family protein [Falsiroseomonas sp. HC035]|uniref:inositol monophosphatase family protein n=1 Tax=Falsiroseomonas sp. HC035 TaxID=3390999 RepID=UPI003D318C3E